jgi:hypothetical protein
VDVKLVREGRPPPPGCDPPMKTRTIKQEASMHRKKRKRAKAGSKTLRKRLREKPENGARQRIHKVHQSCKVGTIGIPYDYKERRAKR